jgi:hypothetical protein
VNHRVCPDGHHDARSTRPHFVESLATDGRLNVPEQVPRLNRVTDPNFGHEEATAARPMGFDICVGDICQRIHTAAHLAAYTEVPQQIEQTVGHGRCVSVVEGDAPSAHHMQRLSPGGTPSAD